MTEDATTEYFEQHVHGYSSARLRFATAEIEKRATSTSSLVDVGCGTGTLLALLGSETGLVDLTGLDVSAKALSAASDQVKCATFQVSILDPQIASTVGRRYDFVVMAAVLHHLVARSRSESRDLATAATRQALELLGDEGYLVIVEPTYTPHWAMSLLFHVKRLMTRVTSERVGVMGQWNNIGAPVVSYYSPRELCDIVEGLGAEIVEMHNADGKLHRLPRILGITGRWETTLVARRKAPAPS